jgi:tRNA uridine 5-carbamoylmethylation protein Kti12
MNVTVMAGVSGSGKSTYANNMDKPVCSTDKFIDDHAREHGVNYSDSFEMIQHQQLFSTITEMFYSEMIEHIKNGIDFIVDRTNLTRGSRQALTNFIRTTAASFGQDVVITCAYISIDEKRHLERLEKRNLETGKNIPLNVIHNQIQAWEIPSATDDGFDIVERKKA